MDAWEVWYEGRMINKVFYNAGVDGREVWRGLVYHDNYPFDIEVRPEKAMSSELKGLRVGDGVEYAHNLRRLPKEEFLKVCQARVYPATGPQVGDRRGGAQVKARETEFVEVINYFNHSGDAQEALVGMGMEHAYNHPVQRLLVATLKDAINRMDGLIRAARLARTKMRRLAR